MPSVQSVLLDRINLAIHKKWRQQSPNVFKISDDIHSMEDSKDLLGKNYFTRSSNLHSAEKMEQRIADLEHNNEQLLYFINFLLENLPDMVTSIFQTNSECQEDLRTVACCTGLQQPCPTRRERDVLDLLAEGLCAKEIANRLHISETTVITHKKHLKEKFSARNTAELISKIQPYLTGKKKP